MKEMTKQEKMEMISKALDEGAKVAITFGNPPAGSVESLQRKMAIFGNMEQNFYPKNSQTGFSFLSFDDYQNNISGSIYFDPDIEKD